MGSHKKIGPDRFSRFDVYWIQTDKQTDKPNLYIDVLNKSEKVQRTAEHHAPAKWFKL